MRRKHRATGNPKGRPPCTPDDLCAQIMKSLQRRVDPETGLVRPFWRQLASELHVSRSTIARRMVELYDSGMIERVRINIRPNLVICYYRLKA